MIALWAIAAHADPVALRGPEVAPTAVVGLHELSVGAPVGDLSLALSVRTDRGAADAVLGRRWRVRGEPIGWRVEVGVAAGLLVPIVRPGLGITVTPWISAGPVRPHGFVQGVIAAPLGIAAPGGARLPVLLELQGGGRVGPVTFGPRLGFGAVVAPGTDVSVATEAALLLSIRPSEGS